MIGLVLAAAALLSPPSAGAASSPVVAVARSVLVSAPVPGRVVVLGGRLTIASRVDGDVVAWGANVSIRPGASIGGDLFVFGGSLQGDTSAVGGRVLAPGSLASLYLAEARRMPWSPTGGALDPVRLGVRLFALALWLAAACLALAARSSGVARVAACFETSPGLAAAAGVVTTAILLLSGVAAVSALPPAGRIPVAGLVLLLAAALKIFGMAGLFLFLGQHTLRNFSAIRRPAALALGVVLAGTLSLVPVAGPVLWGAGSVLAVGAAAVTRFGSPRLRVALS